MARGWRSEAPRIDHKMIGEGGSAWATKNGSRTHRDDRQACGGHQNANFGPNLHCQGAKIPDLLIHLVYCTLGAAANFRQHLQQFRPNLRMNPARQMQSGSTGRAIE